MGLNEGHAWVSLGGVGHVELNEGFFGLTRIIEKEGMVRLEARTCTTLVRIMLINYMHLGTCISSLTLKLLKWWTGS